MIVAEASLTPANHRRVAEFMERAAGIQLPAHKRSLIESRLRRRVATGGYESISDYLDAVLAADGCRSERDLLIDALTTNKTEFFRERAHFDFLGSYLKTMISERGGHPGACHVWSAACSTGEEPYSLAMLLHDVHLEHPEFTPSLMASDIAQSVLDTARQAVYPIARAESIPMAWRRRYLLRSRDRSRGLVRIVPALRQSVHFFPFNLISGDYPEDESLDIIFCRNVMIYFNDRDRARVVERLRRCLRPGGLLFVGHSESIGRRSDFETLRPAVFRRRGESR